MLQLPLSQPLSRTNLDPGALIQELLELWWEPDPISKRLRKQIVHQNRYLPYQRVQDHSDPDEGFHSLLALQLHLKDVLREPEMIQEQAWTAKPLPQGKCLQLPLVNFNPEPTFDPGDLLQELLRFLGDLDPTSKRLRKQIPHQNRCLPYQREQALPDQVWRLPQPDCPWTTPTRMTSKNCWGCRS